MGITVTTIHVFSDLPPADCGLVFREFSPHWQSCTEDLSEKGPEYSRGIAKALSGQEGAPVVHYSMLDSDRVWFEVFYQGKAVGKRFDIPALIGHEDGSKRRLSAILNCADAELQTAMEILCICLKLTALEKLGME